MSLFISSPRLLAAKAALAAVIVATLTVSTVIPDPGSMVSRDVQRAAVVGLYGAAPAFEALNAMGWRSPKDILTTGVGLVGIPGVTDAVSGLLTALAKVSPVEVGWVGLDPHSVFGAVNGLDYSTDAIAGMLGIDPGNPVYQFLINAAGPMANQRRAFLVAEGLGGTTVALGLQQMIGAVISNDAGWGRGSPGVTGIVALLFHNPSRPGGGLLALLTPLTRLVGVDLSNPNAGSYTNVDRSKVLNLSLTDVGWEYDLASDAPTSLNPLSWLNAFVGQLMVTYLMPANDLADQGAALNTVLPGVLGGGLNSTAVTLDPTGGQGVSLLPVLGNFLALVPGSGLLTMPGNSSYLTYRSGNLPLLEVVDVVPRLLGYLPFTAISTPVSASFKDALRMLVDTGYQDVRLTTTSAGDPAFVRGFDRADQQAEIWKPPLTAAESLQSPRAMFDATVVGLMNNLLRPEAQRLQLMGIDLSPMAYGNVVMSTLAHVGRDALTQFKSALDPVLDDAAAAVAPIAQALDHEPGVTTERHASTRDSTSITTAPSTVSPPDHVGEHRRAVQPPTPVDVDAFPDEKSSPLDSIARRPISPDGALSRSGPAAAVAAVPATDGQDTSGSTGSATARDADSPSPSSSEP